MVTSRQDLIAKMEAHYKRSIISNVEPVDGFPLVYYDPEAMEGLIGQYVKKDLIIRDLKIQIADYEREVKNIKSLILE